MKFFVILLLSGLVYGANFWEPSVYVLDEAKNAGCAMEMMQRSDLIVPTFNGELRTDKPPLHYFFMISAYSLFGITPFAARFFSVLVGILLILHIFLFVKKHISESCAFVTSLILICSLQLAIQFHLAVPDPYLILVITSSILFFYEGFAIGSRKKMAFFYIAIALGFITKGLIALVLPGAIVFLYLLMRKQFTLGSIKKLDLPFGILIFCLIGLPWYAAVGYKTNGIWLEGFFLEHNLARYTSTMEGHRGFFLTPFLILIAGLLPFSFLIVQSVRYGWKLRDEKPFILLCLITVIVIPGFFSFSKTILPSYPAPALPFLAIVLGTFWSEKFLKTKKRRWDELLALSLYAIIAIAIPIGVYVAISTEFSAFKVEYLAYYFILLPLGALLSLVLYMCGMRKDIMYILSSSWILTAVLFFYICFPRIDKINPVSQTLPLLEDHKVAYYGDLNPAYVFALKSPVAKLKSEAEVKEFLNTRGRLITQEKYLTELPNINAKILFRQKDLFENPVTIILEEN